MRGLLDDRAAPIAASMTWQGTKTAGLAAEGPEQREGWRDPSVLFRDGKSRRKLWTPENTRGRHCRASGGAAGFRASRVLRGGEARPAHGGPRLSIAHQKTACSGAVANNANVSARSRSEGKRLPRTALRKGQKWRGLETCKGGSASGGAYRASQRPLCPRSRRTKGCKKEGPPSLGAIKPRIALRWPCRLRLSTILLGLLRFNAEASIGDYCQRLVLKQRSRFPQRMSSVFYDPFRPKMHACSG